MDNLCDFNSELRQILDECRKYVKYGKVANYIPELEKSDPNKLGVYMISQGEEHFAGDHDIDFTMQSVVKPLILPESLRKTMPLKLIQPYIYQKKQQETKTEHLHTC